MQTESNEGMNKTFKHNTLKSTAYWEKSLNYHLIIFLIELKILSDSSFILLNKNHIKLSSHKRIVIAIKLSSTIFNINNKKCLLSSK